MSAVVLTQNDLFIRSRRNLSELEAIYQISHIVAHAATLDEALHGIHKAALLVSGIARVHLMPSQALRRVLSGSIFMCAQPTADTVGSAVTELVFNKVKWGELRIHFELQPVPVESALRFARFLAEQIGSALVRFHLLSERESLHRKTERFAKIVARRKAIHRAIALLIHTHRISEGEALTLLRRYARESGHGLLQIAEAIIFGDRQRWRSEPIRFPAKRQRRYRTAAAAAGR